MRVIGQSDSYLLYSKEGFNMNILNRGTSVNMVEVYDYIKRTNKSLGDLTRQEYLMFKK